MTRMTIDPVTSRAATALLALGITVLVVKGAAWSYPQGADTIWTIGAATAAAVLALSARDVWKAWRKREAS